MNINPSQILFLFTLTSGTFLSISANSWLGAWMGLEINLLSFIPLMSNSNNLLTTEVSLKYFLIQALASTFFLFLITMMHLSFDTTNFSIHKLFPILISFTLMLKMGAAPFHFWFPGVMEGLNWFNCFILLTWQKIAPLMLLSYLIKMSLIIPFIILSSVMIGSIGGLNQTSLKKIMAYSSINHIGWMIAAMITGENLWMIYFSIYSFLTITLTFMFNSFKIFHINQSFSTFNNTNSIKFLLFLNLLSLGGLPPFIGFLPKWMIIQSMVELNHTFTISIMVIMTLITLFYYLRLSFSAFLLSYTEFKWITISIYMNLSFILSLILSTISILGLMLCTILFNTF
uniref:NADH-ubiquinone oxidoreductase chain 2 n=1 Tax=Micropathus cavernicola TaxID=3073456 RepID=A0AAU7BA00_9ORTH